MTSVLFFILGLVILCIAAMLATVFFPIVIAIKLYALCSMGVCRSKNRLEGKTVVITGGNSGIGKETAIDLAKRGARVIIACRNLQKAETAKAEIIKKSGNKTVIVRELDLASFASIRKFSREMHQNESKIDILINNAGVLGTPYRLTGDGFEYQMQTNYFGPFLMTNLLLDLVLKAENSRIVNVCSVGHFLCRQLQFIDLNFNRDKFGGKYLLPFRIYCASKLCKVLFTNQLAATLKKHGKNTTVNSLHPGVVFTDIGKYSALAKLCQWLLIFLIKTPKQGAQTSIYLAVDDEVANVSGKYFSDCHESTMSILARDASLADTLWYVTERLVKLQPHERVLEG